MQNNQEKKEVNGKEKINPEEWSEELNELAKKAFKKWREENGKKTTLPPQKRENR